MFFLSPSVGVKSRFLWSDENLQLYLQLPVVVHQVGTPYMDLLPSQSLTCSTCMSLALTWTPKNHPGRSHRAYVARIRRPAYLVPPAAASSERPRRRRFCKLLRWLMASKA